MKDDIFKQQHTRDRMRYLLAIAKKKSDFQRVQCIWLRGEMAMKSASVARITGLKSSTVRKIWADFLRDGEAALFERSRGGRRNSHLSKEEEILFLEPFFRKMANGDSVEVAEIQEAYENHIGKRVPKSTIYRLLDRHGWKKKTNRKKTSTSKEEQQTNMHEYWIEGCSQVLHPERTGNISQQWLNQTLRRMTGTNLPSKNDKN